MTRRITWLALIVAVLVAGCAGPSGPPSHAAPVPIASPGPADPTETRPSNEVAFLWREPFPKLAIEFYLAPDLAPSQVAAEALVDTLENLTKKEVASVERIPLTGWASEHRAWTPALLDRLAQEHSRYGLGPGEYGANETAILHVYYLKGYYDYPTGAKKGAGGDGRAYLFFDPMKLTWARPGVQEKSERATLIHEAGHAIGLVNCGLPMVTPREDPESRCHSTNAESVMGSGEITIWPPDPMRVPQDRVFIYTFDENDIADVRTFQAAEPTG